MTQDHNIILYHYSYSPFARRITWYLTLRGIPYKQCLQPPILPRPDIELLGLKHRRIPIMAIGRDIIYDTRLMLRKIEELFPDGALSTITTNNNDSNNANALEELLEEWTITQIFPQATRLIPTNTPLMQDPKFIKDREDFSGRSWKVDDIKRSRPEAVVYVRGCFEFLEKTLLGDGREWILGTEKLSLADLKTIWPFHWLLSLRSALPATHISPAHFPRVYAWIQRFQNALASAKATSSAPDTISGADALHQITTARFLESNLHVDEDDPLQLRKGDTVDLYPTDTGVRHRDVGMLVGLNAQEIVVECRTKKGEEVVRVHAPRTGFRVRKVVNNNNGRGARL